MGVQGCAPLITASLRHAKSGRPALLVSFREPAVSTAVSALTLRLPATLSGRRHAGKGVHVVAGKRTLGRKFFSLAGRTLVLRNLPAGTHVVKVGLSRGAIKPRASLRRRTAAGKRPLLSFAIQMIDSAGTKSSFTKKTRAKP